MEVKGKGWPFEPWNLKSAVSWQPYKVSHGRHFQDPPTTDYSPMEGRSRGGVESSAEGRKEKGKREVFFCFCFLGALVFVSLWPRARPGSDMGRGSVDPPSLSPQRTSQPRCDIRWRVAWLQWLTRNCATFHSPKLYVVKGLRIGRNLKLYPLRWAWVM